MCVAGVSQEHAPVANMAHCECNDGRPGIHSCKLLRQSSNDFRKPLHNASSIVSLRDQQHIPVLLIQLGAGRWHLLRTVTGKIAHIDLAWMPI